VMNHGRIEQIGTPREIYLWPQTRFAAEFVGSNNLLEGKITSVDGELVALDCDFGRFFVTLPADQAARSFRPSPRSSATLVIQASKMRQRPAGVPHENHVQAVLTQTEFTGSQIVHYLQLPNGQEIRMIAPEPFSGISPAPGAAIDVYWSPGDCVLIGPSVVPGLKNIPGGKSYVRLGG
jgi:ABC-type Fe3+/spermidine/putrescine transport system ATPase subunit